MSKFKVGDKVRVLPHDIMLFRMQEQIGKIGTVIRDDGSELMQYRLNIGDTAAPWYEHILELVQPSMREFIVIRRDGQQEIASRKRGDEIVKTENATCNASDTFDFNVGAKLAFDRLMGREEPNPEPKTAHKFKAWDLVVHDILGILKIKEFVLFKNECGYLAPGENEGYAYNVRESELSPVPEPPKFYTGKVFAVETIENDTREEMRNRIGRVFEIKNGIIIGEVNEYCLDGYSPITSFSDFCSKATATKWREIKE